MTNLVCCRCNRAFQRPASTVKPGTQKPYCSLECRRAKDVLTCAGCGSTFERIPSATRVGTDKAYCSLACRDLAITATCAACGKDFRRPRWHAKRPSEQAYCSMVCTRSRVALPCKTCGTMVERERKQRQIAATDDVYCSPACRLRRVTVACRSCGKTFDRIQADATHAAFYCSRACRRLAIKLTCAACGRDFERTPGLLRARGSNRVFCSHACYFKLAPTRETREKLSAVSRGAFLAKHPEIDPATYTVVPVIWGPHWIRQRKAAVKRDNYTCRHCGVHRPSRELDVHHLRPRRDFTPDDPAMNHLDNLITLCGSCHTRVTLCGLELELSA